MRPLNIFLLPPQGANRKLGLRSLAIRRISPQGEIALEDKSCRETARRYDGLSTSSVSVELDES